MPRVVWPSLSLTACPPNRHVKRVGTKYVEADMTTRAFVWARRKSKQKGGGGARGDPRRPTTRGAEWGRAKQSPPHSLLFFPRRAVPQRGKCAHAHTHTHSYTRTSPSLNGGRGPPRAGRPRCRADGRPVVRVGGRGRQDRLRQAVPRGEEREGGRKGEREDGGEGGPAPPPPRSAHPHPPTPLFSVWVQPDRRRPGGAVRARERERERKGHINRSLSPLPPCFTHPPPPPCPPPPASSASPATPPTPSSAAASSSPTATWAPCWTLWKRSSPFICIRGGGRRPTRCTSATSSPSCSPSGCRTRWAAPSSSS